jgi:hypothetical protein
MQKTLNITHSTKMTKYFVFLESGNFDHPEENFTPDGKIFIFYFFFGIRYLVHNYIYLLLSVA